MDEPPKAHRGRTGVKPVDYDVVAPHYDRRYGVASPSGIEVVLRGAASETRARSVLEVGCGTGHWLPTFGAPLTCGADRSIGMLARAAAKGRATLVAADAQALPFAGPAFDVIANINALHHFSDPRAYLEQAVGLLRPGGAALVIGMDPSAGHDRWYLYEYFPETLNADLDRYPPHAALRRWMRALGLERVTTRVALRIQSVRRGSEVFTDPILHRQGTSQLTLLDDAAFDRGMARVQDAASGAGEPVTFTTDIVLPVTRGFLPG